jgi:uncharacterized membrane protein
MMVLTLGGIGISLYLMWGYTTPGASLACGSSHGCETVKNSVYANLMGIPMPTLGLISYLVLLGLLAVQPQVALKKQAWTPYIALAIFGISLAGVLYSAYLTYLELFVIYAICRWCVASAVVMVALFILSIFNLHTYNQSYFVER